MGRPLIDLTGQKFGRLTVLGRTDQHKSGNIIWACRCDCGQEHGVVSTSLRSGRTRSCGCLRSEKARQPKSKKPKRQPVIPPNFRAYLARHLKDKCLIWLGGTNGNGLPAARVKGKVVVVGRILWERRFGKIPDGLYLRRTCGRAICVEPRHGELVDNVDLVRGGNVPKLTEADAIEIRRGYANGDRVDILAQRFGVHSATIRAVCNYRTWQDVGGLNGTP